MHPNYKDFLFKQNTACVNYYDKRINAIRENNRCFFFSSKNHTKIHKRTGGKTHFTLMLKHVAHEATICRNPLIYNFTGDRKKNLTDH